LRLDSDTAAGTGAHGDVLSRFERRGAAILVGTQMVAKGHDFPDVTLSVVVDADASLRFPDFRAEERTFALVAQLAGRSGRGKHSGRVIVQTLAPEADAIKAAAAHDAQAFIGGELERRRALGYPPFSALIRIEVGATQEPQAQAAIGAIHDALAPLLPEEASLLGPAPRFRVRGRHRRQLLVKATERQAAVSAVRAAVEQVSAARRLRGVALSVDVDPQ
jgi:primosomal protein N' (replication factor Y)